MKIVIVLVTLWSLAMCAPQVAEKLADKERSISSVIVDAIEEIKLQMPCGFPKMGIPPLAPLRTSHQAFNILGISGNVDNFRMDGLDNFDIVEFKNSALLRKVTFHFHWHNVNFTTLYTMDTQSESDSRLSMHKQGKAFFAIKDFVIQGSLSYALGLISNNFQIKTFYVYPTVGEVHSEIENLSKYKFLNRKINEVIEEWFMLAINDSTDDVADFTNTVAKSAMNDQIGDRSLADIIALAVGSGGGEPTEKVPCVPPEDV